MFKKIGSPEPTLSVVAEDGKVSKRCPKCGSMEQCNMTKQAFVDGKSNSDACSACKK